MTSDAVERLLSAATDPRGTRPVPWAVAPIREAEHVLDLGCGPLAGELAQGRWIGLAPRVPTAARTPTLRATVTDLPIRTNGVDAVCMFLTLHRLTAVDAMFAEIRRVLRPGGTLVVVTPSAVLRSLPELRLARLLMPVRRGAWPNRSALDNAGWLLTAADFAVLGDDRLSFAVPLPDGESAVRAVGDLPRAGLWPPGLPAPVRARLSAELARRTGPGRVLPIPLRRLVARR